MQTPFVEFKSEQVFRVGHLTNEGRTGKNNEDNYAIFEAEQLAEEGGAKPTPVYVAVVADGIGGSVKGELASQQAIEHFVTKFKQERTAPIQERLEGAILQANREIFKLAQEDPTLKGMGTTVVAAAVVNELLHVAHAGDSRAYLVRQGRIHLLTLDHSWAQEAIDAEYLTLEEAEHHPNRNVIKRYVGPLDHVAVDHRIIDVENVTGDVRLPQFRQYAEQNQIKLQAGDTLLLSSDGLTDEISETAILQIVTKYAPPQAARELIKAANNAGGRDNITALLLQRPGGTGRLVANGAPLATANKTEQWNPIPPVAAPASEAATQPRKLPLMPLAALVLFIIGAFGLWQMMGWFNSVAPGATQVTGGNNGVAAVLTVTETVPVAPVAAGVNDVGPTATPTANPTATEPATPTLAMIVAVGITHTVTLTPTPTEIPALTETPTPLPTADGTATVTPTIPPLQTSTTTVTPTPTITATSGTRAPTATLIESTATPTATDTGTPTPTQNPPTITMTPTALPSGNIQRIAGELLGSVELLSPKTNEELGKNDTTFVFQWRPNRKSTVEAGHAGALVELSVVKEGGVTLGMTDAIPLASMNASNVSIPIKRDLWQTMAGPPWNLQSSSAYAWTVRLAWINEQGKFEEIGKLAEPRPFIFVLDSDSEPDTPKGGKGDR
ncbi:MAG: protein phosphatase 2C domain-containing protein [Caldilineaceae bacterium]